ncbi:hypothetical protein [Streptomyces sp. NPDC001914]|uniref:hypothetical protein n=1 Tax=Streptomyces sp. NPDC001914 TaxID=3364623 RepID=UPI0036B29200
MRPLPAAHLTTATDVLRLLQVWPGREADLLEPRRLLSLPRPLRRELLAVLDGFTAASLVEDVLRHPLGWKRAAGILHPYEHHERHSKAALALAVLRATDTSATPLGEALLRTAAAYPEAVRIDGTRIRPEQALRDGDFPGALGLLARRPGELLRRLDHLLRLHDREELPAGFADTLRRVLPGAGPGPPPAALGREGDSRIHVPLLVDLERRTFLWTDLHLPASEGFHGVYRHGADLGRVGRDLFQYFTTGRTSLWDLAVWHAAARTEEAVVVRRARSGGELWHYARGRARAPGLRRPRTRPGAHRAAEPGRGRRRARRRGGREEARPARPGARRRRPRGHERIGVPAAARTGRRLRSDSADGGGPGGGAGLSASTPVPPDPVAGPWRARPGGGPTGVCDPEGGGWYVSRGPYPH